MRLNEVALHGWDVKVAADPQATLTSQEADVAFEQLTGPLNFMFGFLGRGPAGTTEVSLRIEAADPHRLLGMVLGDTVSFNGAPVRADGVLAGPAEAIVRLLFGRLGAAHTPDSLTLTGDAITLDDLRARFPGI